MNSSKQPAQSRRKAKNGDKNEPPTKDPAVCSQIKPWIKGANAFPTGRQLPRTPPASQRDRGSLAPARTPEGPTVCKQPRQTEGGSTNYPASAHGIDRNCCAPAAEEVQGGGEREHRVRRHSTITAAVQQNEMNLECFIKGMQGYQWTAEDLEFVERAKNERQVRQLKAELCVLLKQLKDEEQKKDLALAIRDKVQGDLAQLADFDRILQLGRDFLCRKLPAAEVENMDFESVLERIRAADIQSATREERSRLVGLEEKLSRLQQLCSNEEHHRKEMESLTDKISQKQAKVEDLKREVSDLKLKISQAETLIETKTQVAALKVQKKPQKEEEMDMTKVLRRSKRIASRKEKFLEREAILKKIHALK
ncbi:uncharacterized protein si:dkeyp-34c12.1 isoform X2 [Brienomyrus brachyistius]|uniref:uncharacterized protein si:dkeyp-34c12.1 isoform X2 n=1 Tax=Brienomyrus brachyistius TaxID=42636 RepID=UPI0020B28983|nr:uncharacterized protein si:dkeyp-34c12.1 isoform X2 [Brienomyrus brachyistius]